MNLTERTAFKQLQQCASKSDAQKQLAGWVVKTGRSGVYYLHQDSSLVVQNLGAARVAMQVLSRVSEGNLTNTDHGAEEDHEDEEKDELLSLCSCLDGVVGQLYAVGIGEQDLVQSGSEEGTAVDDGFIVPEGPRMAKLSMKVQEISDALDLVPE